MCTPPSFLEGEGGVEPPTKFSKRGGLDKTLTFRGGLLGKGGDFFQAGGGGGGGGAILKKKKIKKLKI